MLLRRYEAEPQLSLYASAYNTESIIKIGFFLMNGFYLRHCVVIWKIGSTQKPLIMNFSISTVNM